VDVSAPVILIIDDEAPAREVLEAYLTGAGYELVFASAPEEGLARAIEIVPDVILLDVKMPGMDGFEVCRRLRTHLSLAEVPVIMTTALDDRTSRLQGLEAGADEFLAKPFDSVELKVRVRAVLRLNRFRRMAREQEGMRNLTAHLQTVREDERTRIAREVHDDLGQLLTALKMDLFSLKADRGQAAEGAARLPVMIGLVNQALATVQRITSELRPGMLDDLGLAAAIEWQCDEFAGRTGFPVFLSIRPADLITDRDRSTALFRIVQETLTNVARHAQASAVHVSLRRKKGMLHLLVRDNGIGAKAEQLAGRTAFGILGMQERVMAIGGRFSVRGIPGTGTIVSVSVPEPEWGERRAHT
jgi:signal transduction histidine kinase